MSDSENIRNVGGRPSIFTPEIAKEICDAIAISNQALQTLCQKNPHWPGYSTLWEWVSDNRQGFADLYAQAKEKQADHLADSILRIIDKPETYIDENGLEKNDVAMMRLKVDSLKWHAMKLKPKKWGEKTQTELTVKHEDNIQDLA